MLDLSPGIHAMLDNRIVEVLKCNQILTVPDLLRTDSNKLKQYMNIGKIRRKLLSNAMKNEKKSQMIQNEYVHTTFFFMVENHRNDSLLVF